MEFIEKYARVKGEEDDGGIVTEDVEVGNESDEEFIDDDNDFRV